ncbi:MAG: cytochrome c biogenesis protein CcdA [Actinomycetota bacterium]|nr:cytochrome c biogenesis protein CcdA [Actinomycetota bacterium]
MSLVGAFLAGAASFSSPCVLPLVPAYLSLVAGMDVTASAARSSAAGGAPSPGVGDRTGSGRPRRSAPARRGEVTFNTFLFVAGFGTVFVLLGLSASGAGRLLVRDQNLLTRVSGVLVVAMAVFLLGTVFLSTPGLYREWRLHPRLARFGPFAAPVAGAAFALGWTPCVGPILASILALSAEQGHLGEAALLLGVYSIGLGAPFVAVALFFDRVRRPLAWLRRHGRGVTVVSAGGLGVMGVLLVLDRLASVTTVLQQTL